MKFWVMAMRVKADGSRPSLREALEVAELHVSRKDCVFAADGVLDGAEYQPVRVEVRLLSKLTPPQGAGTGGEGREGSETP